MNRMGRSADAARKPPTPSESHAEIDAWMRRLMPEMNPIVQELDGLIRETIPGLHYAVKWKQAYYGLPDLGWLIELVSYAVSVNVVFLGGAQFNPAPPLGSGSSRYVKVKGLEEAREPALLDWIQEAGQFPGWR